MKTILMTKENVLKAWEEIGKPERIFVITSLENQAGYEYLFSFEKILPKVEVTHETPIWLEPEEWDLRKR